jgi:hypothetical protein
MGRKSHRLQIGTDEGDCILGAAKGVSDRLGSRRTSHRLQDLAGREPQPTQIGTDKGDCILGAAKGVSDGLGSRGTSHRLRGLAGEEVTDCADWHTTHSACVKTNRNGVLYYL